MKQNVIDDYNLLSGQQKAAILMMSLDEDKSAQIFALMDDEEIKELSVIMASLGKVNSNVVEQLFQEFAEKSSNTGTLIGTFESTERLLSKTLDKDRVSAIMEEISGPAGRTMWDKLGNVNEHVLANYLKNEYPQTIAVILSKIKAEHAAKVIALLPENFAMEIVMRMLRMDSVQKEVLDGLEKTLRKEFMSNLSKSTRRDSHELIADIFNSLDRNTEGRFMEALEERNRESAERYGAEPCGNARAFAFSDEPLIRMRNTAVLPGTSKLEDIIASVDDGYLLCDTNNGQADTTGEFMFGVTMGYEIKKGKLGRAILDTTISGVAFEMLKTVDMVSDEVVWASSGYCGKKQLMPVGLGGPALRCRVTIGGR